MANVDSVLVILACRMALTFVCQAETGPAVYKVVLFDGLLGLQATLLQLVQSAVCLFPCINQLLLRSFLQLSRTDSSSFLRERIFSVLM